MKIVVRIPHTAKAGDSVQGAVLNSLFFRMLVFWTVALFAVPIGHDGRTAVFMVPPGSKPGSYVNLRVPSSGGEIEATPSPQPVDRHETKIDILEDSKVKFDMQSAMEHFKTEDYNRGDDDVVKASLYAGVSFDEMVLIVW